jgi:hypothetical protein
MHAGEATDPRIVAEEQQQPEEPSGSPVAGGMGQAALVALTALAACGVLIVVGATMSMCWAVHPSLTVAAAALVVWAARRAAAHAFRTGGRTQ